VFGFIGPNGSRQDDDDADFFATLLKSDVGRGIRSAAIRFTRSRKRFGGSSATCQTFFGVYGRHEGDRVSGILRGPAYRIRGPESGKNRSANRCSNSWKLGYKREALVTSLSRGMTPAARAGEGTLCTIRKCYCSTSQPAASIRGARIEIRRLLKQAARDREDDHGLKSHPCRRLADVCNKVGIIERGELIVNAAVADVLKQVRRPDGAQYRPWAGDQAAAAKLLEQHDIVDHVENRAGVSLPSRSSRY